MVPIKSESLWSHFRNNGP